MCAAPVLSPVPWTPVSVSMSDEHSGPRLGGGLGTPEARARVRWVGHNTIEDAGLFPSLAPDTLIKTGCRFHQQGHVQRRAVPRELWGLWDVPLSCQEAWSAGADVPPCSTEVWHSAPAKILAAGGCARLWVLERGGFWAWPARVRAPGDRFDAGKTRQARQARVSRDGGRGNRV